MTYGLVDALRAAEAEVEKLKTQLQEQALAGLSREAEWEEEHELRLAAEARLKVISATVTRWVADPPTLGFEGLAAAIRADLEAGT